MFKSIYKRLPLLIPCSIKNNYFGFLLFALYAIENIKSQFMIVFYTQLFMYIIVFLFVEPMLVISVLTFTIRYVLIILGYDWNLLPAQGEPGWDNLFCFVLFNPFSVEIWQAGIKYDFPPKEMEQWLQYIPQIKPFMNN